MPKLAIKQTSPAIRCEICHQADQFSALTNSCARCKDIALNQSKSSIAHCIKIKLSGSYADMLDRCLIRHLPITLAFYGLDLCQPLEKYWMVKGKAYYLIPTPAYHLIGSLFVATAIALCNRHVITKFNGQLLPNARRKLNAISLFVLLAMPLLSYLVCALQRLNEDFYFPLAPAIIGIIFSIPFHLLIKMPLKQRILMLGCLLAGMAVVPFIGHILFSALNISFLYTICSIWLAFMQSYFLLKLISSDQNSSAQKV